MTTVDTLVQLLADRAPPPMSLLTIPTGWSEERRYMNAGHLVVERSIGLTHRLRVSAVEQGFGWVLEVETATGQRRVERDGFRTLADAKADAYGAVGL